MKIIEIGRTHKERMVLVAIAKVCRGRLTTCQGRISSVTAQTHVCHAVIEFRAQHKVGIASEAVLLCKQLALVLAWRCAILEDEHFKSAFSVGGIDILF